MLGSVFENDGKNDILSFCFFKWKMKQRVSGSWFWFENEIVDIVLSNRFRKQNETKISSKNVFLLFFFNDEKMFINNFFKLKKCTWQSHIFWKKMLFRNVLSIM